MLNERLPKNVAKRDLVDRDRGNAARQNVDSSRRDAVCGSIVAQWTGERRGGTFWFAMASEAREYMARLSEVRLGELRWS